MMGKIVDFGLGSLPLGYFFFQLFVRANEVRHSFDDAFLKYLVRSAQRIVLFAIDTCNGAANRPSISHRRYRAAHQYCETDVCFF